MDRQTDRQAETKQDRYTETDKQTGRQMDRDRKKTDQKRQNRVGKQKKTWKDRHAQ